MKQVFFSVIFLLPLLASAQQNYTVQATIPAYSDGTMVYMIGSRHGDFFRDSTLVKKGMVEFRGVTGEPSKCVLRIEQAGQITDIVHFYLEPANLVLKSADSLKNAQVTNSQLNKDNYAFQKQGGRFLQAMLDMRMKAAKMSKEEIKAAGEELNKKYKLLTDSFRVAQKKFIQSHPASFLSLEMLEGYAGAFVDAREINPLFEKLSPKIRATSTGIAFAQVLAKAEAIKIGNHAPLFVTNTPFGDSLSLKQVLAQSKWVLVDFWASWCKPCRAENPNVVKAYQQYHEQGLNIISISLDKTAAYWKEAIEKDGMPWSHGSSLKGSDDTTAQLYGVDAIPDNFLLDANGVILARALRGKALEAKLAELAAKR